MAADYQSALGYFQQAEQVDPTYIYGAELREGVSSFVGRAQYSRETIRKRAKICKSHFFSTGPTTLHGYTSASRTNRLGGPEGGTDEYSSWHERHQ